MKETDKEDKIILARIEDEMDRCERENRICFTDFLDMRLQGMAESMAKSRGCRFYFYGGYDGAERRLMMFLPDWAEPSDGEEDCPVEILRVRYRQGGKELSHRDFLGSILGLGLSRSKIGDIIVYGGGADIIILKDLEEFLLANYFKAGRTELSLSAEDISKLDLSEIKTEIITDTLASLRLDAFLASAYRSSRSKAVEAVKQGLVYINHALCLKPDAEIKEGDCVVLRGKGKCVLKSVGGTSKKDRTFVEIEKYI